MNSNWLLLLTLAVGTILFVVGNEQLLTYTQYDPSTSHMTIAEFETQKTESLEARFWWIIQLFGLTLSVISLLEIAVLGQRLMTVT